MRRLLALLVTSVLLAGCSDDAPGDGAEADAGTDDAFLAPVATGAAPPKEPAPVPEPLTRTCELKRTNLGTNTGYGLNIDRAVIGIEECPLEDLFDRNTTWAQAALVEATWTAQATQTGAELWIESTACQPTPIDPCEQPRAMGTSSPMTLELTAQQLRAVEGHGPLVMAWGQGAVVDLVFTLHITLFPGAIPAGFSALP